MSLISLPCTSPRTRSGAVGSLGQGYVLFSHHYTLGSGTAPSKHFELVGEKLHGPREKTETHLLCTYCERLPRPTVWSLPCRAPTPLATCCARGFVFFFLNTPVIESLFGQHLRSARPHRNAGAPGAVSSGPWHGGMCTFLLNEWLSFPFPSPELGLVSLSAQPLSSGGKSSCLFQLQFLL